MINQALSVVILVSITSVATAAELFEEYVSIRALGMGNAFSPLARGADAMFYNPAGLARNDGFTLTLFDAQVGANGVEAAQEILALAKSDDLISAIREFYGKKISASLGSKVGFTGPNFGFLAYDSAQASLILTNPPYPNMEINFTNDYGFSAGLAFDLVENFQFGMVARRITRMGGRAPIGPSLIDLTSDAIVSELQQQGVGYAFDAGILISLPSSARPTFSVSWRNIGYTTFKPVSQDQGAPPRIPSEIIVGLGLSFEASLVTVAPVMEMKYVNDSSIQIGKRVHFGLEVDMPLIDLRVGFHQGYYTLGAGGNFGVFRVDAATYGVELGEYPGQLEDRRYLVQFALEFNFDPSFGFLGSGSGSGGGRRLKLRR